MKKLIIFIIFVLCLIFFSLGSINIQTPNLFQATFATAQSNSCWFINVETKEKVRAKCDSKKYREDPNYVDIAGRIGKKREKVDKFGDDRNYPNPFNSKTGKK